MEKKLILKLLVGVFLISNSLSGFSQGKDQTPAAPHISVTLGGYNGGKITPDILSRIIDSALVARDKKGNTYSPVRFRCIYKFKNQFQDRESGEKKTTDDMRVNEFIHTGVMSELWRQSIKDNISKGDEMILDNIIVSLKNGAKIMAPSITFKIM